MPYSFLAIAYRVRSVRFSSLTCVKILRQCGSPDVTSRFIIKPIIRAMHTLPYVQLAYYFQADSSLLPSRLELKPAWLRPKVVRTR